MMQRKQLAATHHTTHATCFSWQQFLTHCL